MRVKRMQLPETFIIPHLTASLIGMRAGFEDISGETERTPAEFSVGIAP